jgi:hypothetical protein
MIMIQTFVLDIIGLLPIMQYVGTETSLVNSEMSPMYRIGDDVKIIIS